MKSVRVLIPGAVSVDIVNRHSGELIVPSEKIDETLLTALHRYAAMSRSKLYAVQLENLLGMSDNLNVPGVFRGLSQLGAQNARCA